MAVGSEGIWRTFATVLGLDPHDPRFKLNRDRVAHRDELVAAIERVLDTAPADHWLDVLHAAGVPTGKVRTMDEVYEWGQTRSQGLLLDVDHPAYGALRLTGSALRFDDNRHSGGREEHAPPPLLDEHGAAIRAWLDEN
jgi:crotonobetainyl-CoA:carnitine CoA-transferase CaiB-like acyl-CoA transferase